MKNLTFPLSIALIAALLESAEGRRLVRIRVPVPSGSSGGDDDDGGAGGIIGIIVGVIILVCCVLNVLVKACDASDSRRPAPIAHATYPTRTTPPRKAPAPTGSTQKVRQLNLNNLQFCFVPGEIPGSPSRAVCKQHRKEVCKLGCKTDYTLMNTLMNNPGYQALKDKTEKYNFTRTFVRNYFHDLPKEPMPAGHTWTIPVDKVISNLEAIAETEDPVKVVIDFASICYVKRCLPFSVTLTNAATQHLQLLRILMLITQAQAPPTPHFPGGMPPAPRTAPPLSNTPLSNPNAGGDLQAQAPPQTHFPTPRPPSNPNAGGDLQAQAPPPTHFPTAHSPSSPDASGDAATDAKWDDIMEEFHA